MSSPFRSGPFRLERIEGCGQCGHGELFDVIGPDDVAHSTQYGDQEEAESVRAGFDRAYWLGHQVGFLEGQGDPWTPFAADTLPPANVALLVWDAQFDSLSSTWWGEGTTLDYARQYQWSHWMRGNRLRPPIVPKVEQATAAEPPTVQPPTVEPPQGAETPPRTPQAPTALEADWDSDIPF